MQKVLNRTLGLFLVIAMMALCMVPALAAKPMNTGKWYDDGMNAFIDKGYITGYGNGDYGPERNMTRAEFIAVVNMESLGGKAFIQNGLPAKQTGVVWHIGITIAVLTHINPPFLFVFVDIIQRQSCESNGEILRKRPKFIFRFVKRPSFTRKKRTIVILSY